MYIAILIIIGHLNNYQSSRALEYSAETLYILWVDLT